MINIDGSFGSGGGQILRTACVLSAVSQNPCRIFNVRKARRESGLATQHLLGIRALAQLCNGELEGDALGSEEIKFYPGKNYKNRISANIPTASSIALFLQILILPALCAPIPIQFDIRGGATDTFFSPTIDYFKSCFLKTLEKMGGKIKIDVLKRGYYPEGGAHVKVSVFPSRFKKINLTERGSLQDIILISGASDSLKKQKVAERQLFGAKEILGKLNLPTQEKPEYYNTRSPGSQTCFVANFANTVIGTDGLGKLGKRAEDIGKETALELLKEQKSGACLDKHLIDQILPFMVFIPSKFQVSSSEITDHCKTNIWVIEKFTQNHNKVSNNKFLDGKFEIKDNLIIWNPF